MRFPTIRSRVAFVVLWPVARAREAYRAVARAVRLMLLRHRENLIGSRGARFGSPRPSERMLVVVTHVVPAGLSGPEREASPRLAYLRACLDAVFRSLAHLEPTVVLNTYAGRHLFDLLPAYQRDRCELLEHASGDPMLIEFAAQDVFLQRASEFDWFLFLEDDIAIHDPLFVDKIREFSQRSGKPDALLLPHRYEMNLGRKQYIDKDFTNAQWRGPEGSDVEDVINRDTILSYESPAGGGRPAFAEFTNPHAACYCLSRRDLSRWDATGRRWYRRASWIGPLESAATGCLFEAFELYKPHPDHKTFLEVEHLEPKYSERYFRAIALRTGGRAP
jgi:hypothetical protein